jgi:GNAT superfamily N-acetyltransferase
LRPKYCDDPRFRIGEAAVKQWRFNKFLYELVGADWRWTDKLVWTGQQWRDWVESESLRTFAAYYEGSVLGYFELQRDEAGDVEIAIFGVAPPYVGRGFGGALLTHAFEQAWNSGCRRVWFHTCSFDHPSALPNYLARGLTIY